MENGEAGGRWLREAPVGVEPAGLSSIQVPHHDRPVPHVGKVAYVWRSGSRLLRVPLLVLGLLGLLGRPSLAQSHAGTTYTGAPFNFCLPGYDSYDYQDCWDFNWAVVNSSFTKFDSSMTYVMSITTGIAASTTTLKNQVTALEVWQGTTSHRIAAHDVFMSTSGPLVDSLQVWKGTASISLASYGVWQGTASVRIAAFDVWMGTMTPHIVEFDVWKGTTSLRLIAYDAFISTAGPAISAEAARALAAEALLAPLTGVGTSGTWPISITGNAGTATALASNPSDAASGYVARGISANGTVEPALVEAAATSGSTNPITSGAAYTALAGKQDTGNYITSLTGGVTASGPGAAAATVVTNANLTGVVTSVGNATSIANGAISNAMLANSAVANLSGTNTGDQTTISGNAGTATALAADPSDAASGYVSRGIDASGTVQPAWVETAATSGSTNPVTSGAMYTALAGKQASDADLDDLADGSLSGSKVGSGVAASNIAAGTFALGVGILPSGVDLSTVTSALATKQAADADLDDLADGSLTGSKVGSGVPAANIADGTMGTVNTGGNAATATALAADPTDAVSGYVCRGVNASGTCQPALVEDSVVNGSTNPVSGNAVFDAIAGAGGGDVTQAGDNAFTGGNTLTGPTTFYGFTDLRGYTPGVFVPFSTATVSAVSAYSFSGLQSTVTWRMEWELAQNTSNGYWQVRINGDSGAGLYRYAVLGNIDNGNNSNAYSTGNTKWDLGASVTGDPVWAGKGGVGWIEFATIPGTNMVVMRCGATYLSSTVYTYSSTSCGGWYAGTAAISSVELSVSAGTFTGDILLSRKVKR